MKRAPLEVALSVVLLLGFGGCSGKPAGGISTGAAGAGGLAPTGGSPGGSGAGVAGGTAVGGTSGAVGGTNGGAPGGAAGTGGGAGAQAALFTVDVKLASDVNPSAPGTIGIVTWSVTVAPLASAHIEFGLDGSYGMTAPVDLSAAGYRTLLLGMKPSRTYHFRIVASDGSASFASGDYSVATGPPTSLVNVTSFNVIDAAARQRGFVIASHRTNSTVAFILDADGDVVWWFGGGPNGIARARMSEDGQNMWIAIAGNTGAPLVRVRMDGLETQSYANVTAAHDITPVGGATMAYLDYGERDCQSIFEIDPGGTAREVFESTGLVSSSNCHGNALRYSKMENVYTFSDHLTDVFVVDRSGAVLWRLGQRVSGGNAAWGGAQHGHQLLEDGLLIFANNGAGTSASQAIEYALDGTERRRFASGGYTANLGDVQRLPGGNTLITYSNQSLIQEVDGNGKVVLEIKVAGSSLAYSLWLTDLYGQSP
jgi:hypothetical protein